MSSCTSSWSMESTGDSRRSSPDVEFFVIKRPSQGIFRKLFQSRTPVRYFDSALRINRSTLTHVKKKIQALIIRHLDLSKLYGDLPQSRLDFLKREVLLDAELSFLTQYEDGWAVDVLVRNLYYRRRRMAEQKLKLAWNAQCPCNQRSFNSRSRVPRDLGPRTRRTQTNASSRVALLSTRLDSATPSLLRFHRAIVRAGLCTDHHLQQLFRMSAKSRDKFILKALGKSTLFERVAVLDILERMNKEQM
ncbi:uncharacterized protein EDB93DRAFT_1181739 [Suillus bovinus]|uniref:uncharacterized protein n=1 Tax=Suillus bovinus TaxID=48563 RepID=UPI001B872F40|nr:uncharacterized protein EDB93DRAFT_1181739 [Suillus bovinus]KAG2129709.1 hypothetical protein EDB93DRAFT_1181739 [Suillus bovinus]